jgi:hypothetical protein
MRVLWAIATTHGHGQSCNTSPKFKPAFSHCACDEVRQEWIARDNDVSARNDYAPNKLSEPTKEGE